MTALVTYRICDGIDNFSVFMVNSPTIVFYDPG